MTRVQIFRTTDGHTRSLVFTGHTDYAEDGADVVCAGVSAIVINTINCLEDLLHESVECFCDEEEGGDLICNVVKDLGAEGELLIECMIHGLEWIEQQYGEEYLNHRIEEVSIC